MAASSSSGQARWGSRPPIALKRGHDVTVLEAAPERAAWRRISISAAFDERY
jgi:hypothetical protein